MLRADQIKFLEFFAAADMVEYRTLNKFGYNADVDTATDPEDIWSGGGVWVPPTQARIHAIVSSDAADAAAGTGLRTIRVFGLDTDGNEIQEDITLNGVTPVNTVNSYIIIQRMYGLTAGSGEVNAGTITATAATDSTITAEIPIGKSQTQMAIYCVPTGWTLFVSDYYGSITRPGATGGGMFEMELWSYADFGNGGSVWRLRHELGGAIEGNTKAVLNFKFPLVFPERTLVKLRCKSVTDNDSIIDGGFDGLLIKNTASPIFSD